MCHRDLLESILNQRSLSPVSVEEVELGPLTPSHLLMTKSVYSDIVGASDEHVVYVRFSLALCSIFGRFVFDRVEERISKNSLTKKNVWVRNEQEKKKGHLVLVIESNVARNKIMASCYGS